MSRTISLRDFLALQQQLPAQIEAACVKGLRSAATRGVGIVVQEIDDPGHFETISSQAGTAHHGGYPPVDTGATRQSVTAEPIDGGAELSVNTPQAAWIEFGTRPHMPPLGPILLWVTRKFGLGSGTSGRKGRKKRAAKAGPKAQPKQGPKLPPQQGPKMNAFHRAQRKSMKHAAKQQHDAANLQKALAIANKVRWRIFHHGTPPKPFFSRAMKHIRLKIAPREVRHELKALEKRL